MLLRPLLAAFAILVAGSAVFLERSTDALGVAKTTLHDKIRKYGLAAAGGY